MPGDDAFHADMRERLARIEERLAAMDGWMRDYAEREETGFRDHVVSEDKSVLAVHQRVDLEASRTTAVGERVAGLEMWRARIGGMTVGAGVLVGIVTAVITALITRIIR